MIYRKYFLTFGSNEKITNSEKQNPVAAVGIWPPSPDSGEPNSSQFDQNLISTAKIRQELSGSGQIARIWFTEIRRQRPDVVGFWQSILFSESDECRRILTIEYQNSEPSTVDLGYQQTPMFNGGGFPQ
jgi:hypothetical protein